ncbi:MAG: HD domain-containing protein [Sulfolobales archaeon]
MDEWPLAYVGVPLGKHLVITARISIKLFDDDLRVLNKRFGRAVPEHLGVKELLAGAALLHDVGKASDYYRNVIKNTKRVSFYMHEIAWPLVLLSLAYVSLDSDPKNELVFKYLELVAGIISRHHASMKCRHPVDLVRDRNYCSKRLHVVREVIRGFDIDTVIGLLNELREAEDFGIPDRVWKALLDRGLLKEAIERSPQNIDHDIQSLVPTNHDDESLPMIISLTGLLIVADTLAASFLEKRESDDGVAPAYALHWRNELWRRFSMFTKANSIEHF